jgi:ApaG protein
LRRRYWHIIDARGYAQEVRGVGVVGEQPKLEPGETYEYASGTALTTPSGIIQGTYEMETEEGEWLTVDIPPFSLDSPYQTVLLN